MRIENYHKFLSYNHMGNFYGIGSAGLMKRLRKYLQELLVGSLNTDQMNDLARNVDPRFDITVVSGFGNKIVIPRQVAADCVISYFQKDDGLLRFIAFMISRDGQPASGGVIHLKSSDRIIKLLREKGWIFDSDQALFIKDQTGERTADWGFLQQGNEYSHVFSSIDIVMSSEFTRLNIREDVETTLVRFRRYIYEKVEKRDGRIWSWSGDGGISVFHGENAAMQSILSMIEILNFLPLFNISKNEMRAESDIRLRIGMHYGTAVYNSDVSRIKSPDLDLAQTVEKNCANPNSIAVTGGLFQFLTPEIRAHFQSSEPIQDIPIYLYDHT